MFKTSAHESVSGKEQAILTAPKLSEPSQSSSAEVGEYRYLVHNVLLYQASKSGFSTQGHTSCTQRSKLSYCTSLFQSSIESW